MSTVKVLHVIARMNVGGTSRYVGDLVENIPGSQLATGHVQGSEVEDSYLSTHSIIRINHLGRKVSLVNDYKAWRELRKIVRTFQPQILHTHTFKAGLIGRLVTGSHKHVHTYHGHLFADRSFSAMEKKIIAFIERLLAHRTQVLVSVGQNVGRELRRAGIGPRQHWVSIPPGVAQFPELDKLKARRSLGVKDSGLLIGWMARMTTVKNPILLLRVAERLPNLQFVMAGGGDLLDKVAARAPSNVAVIGWADAEIFWSAVDLGISTSDNEGMPLALIEAQLSGIPVIATDVGSNSEVIEDQQTGFVVNKNIDALVNAIEQFVTSPELIKTMGERGRERAHREFSLNKMILSHLEIY